MGLSGRQSVLVAGGRLAIGTIMFGVSQCENERGCARLSSSAVPPSAESSVQGRNIAVDYLRSFVIVLVVFLHAALAYVSFGVYYPLHYIDSVSPVADPSRWPLLDPLFSFVYMFAVPLLFLVSGLFVFPALDRKGSAGFFFSRLRRLGIPFVVSAFLISPLAFWPSYLMATTNSPTPYWIRYFTTDGWLIGAPWFLWVLLVFDGIVALIHRIAPTVLERLRREPSPFFVLLATVIAFLPVILFPRKDTWFTWFGPFDVQPLRLPLYFVYFLLGMALGACQHDRKAAWPKRWGIWFLVALLAFAVYGFTGNSIAFAVCCAGSSSGLLGAFRHFVQHRIPIIDDLNANAFGIYLFHYPLVHWLQFILVPLSWPAWMKFGIVFIGGLALSWGLSKVVRQIPAVRHVL